MQEIHSYLSCCYSSQGYDGNKTFFHCKYTQKVPRLFRKVKHCFFDPYTGFEKLSSQHHIVLFMILKLLLYLFLTITPVSTLCLYHAQLSYWCQENTSFSTSDQSSNLLWLPITHVRTSNSSVWHLSFSKNDSQLTFIFF